MAQILQKNSQAEGGLVHNERLLELRTAHSQRLLVAQPDTLWTISESTKNRSSGFFFEQVLSTTKSVMVWSTSGKRYQNMKATSEQATARALLIEEIHACVCVCPTLGHCAADYHGIIGIAGFWIFLWKNMLVENFLHT